MKQLTCEMCGGTDLVKKDGIFVCQTCGTKYSVEDAKKMMIEGVVDVTGSTIKVDNSEELINLYKLARRAKDENNSEQAAKYYEQILIKDPNSWEASFYSTYYSAVNCKIGEIGNAAYSVEKNLKSTFELINTSEELDKNKIYNEIFLAVMNIGTVLSKASLNYRMENCTVEGVNAKADTWDKRIFSMFITLGDYMAFYANDNSAAIKAYLYPIEKTGNIKQFSSERSMAEDKIKKIDPDYIIPVKQTGCYVATAVYGSYDCPQVWTLRRYRDYNLAESWYGRAFIWIYYAISPTIVKWFGDTRWFKRMWRGKLDRMVKNLQEKGYESTPYEDRNW